MSLPYVYEKPVILRRVLKRYMSQGLIMAEGHRHRVQRKIVQRLFSSIALKRMAEVVEAKTDEVGFYNYSVRSLTPVSRLDPRPDLQPIFHPSDRIAPRRVV